MKLLLCLLLASGGVLIGLSIPLIQRKVPPNPWYGFRVRRTLEDPEIWYPTNAYSGWCMLRLGAAIMIAAVVAYFVSGLDDAWYASTVGVVAVIGVIAGLVQSFRYLRKLTAEKQIETKVDHLYPITTDAQSASCTPCGFARWIDLDGTHETSPVCSVW